MIDYDKIPGTRPMTVHEAKEHPPCCLCGHATYVARGEAKCMCNLGPSKWTKPKQK